MLSQFIQYIIYMNNIPQRILDYNIGLVKYENPRQKDGFDLTTIHSLLIDHNPRFIQLRQLIAQYNSKQAKRQIHRPHLQRSFIERLYKMLSQLTRIPNSQNQLKYLNKIYLWAFQDDANDGDVDGDGMPAGDEKLRPGTASTKTRPYSAANTRRTRPDSGIPSKQNIPSKRTQETQTISKKVMANYPKVDFKQLKHGQADFFLGHRTLHPQQQKPRVRLKQYQRKIIYDETDPDSRNNFQEFIEQKQKKPALKKQKLVQIPLVEQMPQRQGEQPIQQGQQGIAGEQDVNIDDLALGEQPGQPGEAGEAGEGGQAQQQQQVQVVDKLKPRVKVYGNPIQPIPDQNIQNLYSGLQRQINQKNKYVRAVQEDIMTTNMMQVWAAAKNKIKNQQRRRAQSARIMTRNTGKQFQKYTKKQQQDFKGQVVDLTSAKITQLKSNTRPFTAFRAESDRIFNQTIENAMKTGKLANHVKLTQNNYTGAVEKKQQIQRLGTFAPKPKKKTFQQILRQAEQRVNNQVNDQIQQVKQTLTNNNIPLGANKIYKSLSYHEHQVYDGAFVGQIIGQGMIKNPFIKIAKKKKKKQTK